MPITIGFSSVTTMRITVGWGRGIVFPAAAYRTTSVNAEVTQESWECVPGNRMSLHLLSSLFQLMMNLVSWPGVSKAST